MAAAAKLSALALAALFVSRVGAQPGTNNVTDKPLDCAVRAAARRMLERQGFTVVEARHGADALLVWQERRAANSLKASNMTPSRSGGGTCGMKGRKVGQTSEKVDE
jgi:hypothetical protein